MRRILSALAVLNDSQSAAVFAPGEPPRLIAALGIEDRHLAAVSRAWARHGDVVSDGEAVRVDSVVVVPVIAADGLSALVCLDRLDEAVCPPSTRDTLLANLGRALARRSGPPLEELATDEAPRAMLLQRLDRNEWNIARVARLYKVTRKTIYERLDRYGIPRKRVPRGA